MSRYIKKIVSAVACAVLTAVFITVMQFAAPKIETVKEATGIIPYSAFDYPDGTYTADREGAVIGKDVTAIRISDLGRLKKITKVNYVPDEFVSPVNLPQNLQIVDLTKPFEFAEKGSLIFVILNLDPENGDFKEQSEKLAPYKIGEKWEFTLSLPKIFAASNVYNKYNLVARHGKIEDYDFIEFINYDERTEHYSPKVERTTVKLQFHTRMQALNQQVITVHYQSAGTVYSGIADCPLIGTESVVSATLTRSQNFLISVAVLAAVVLAILVVLSLLKRTKNLINSIVWISGIFLMLFPKFLLGQATAVPLFWVALTWSAAFITLGGALSMLGRNFGKFPAKYFFIAMMATGGVLALVHPLVPYGAAKILKIIFSVIKALGSLALLVFTFFSALDKNDCRSVLEIVTASVIAVATLASVFTRAVFPVYGYHMFWLCVLTVVTTFVGVFKLFKDTEKANAYLTANLHLEVDRQLKDIKAVISERDDLLRFVSHDMKKPLQSSALLLDTLIDREKDTEQTKALLIVKQNNSRVIGNLSEIGSYTRFNYIAEPSQTTDLFELCASLCDFHGPDCNANGIILDNSVDKRFKVFAKKNGLENAVSNIILNAIEHANCKTITLAASERKNKIILKIIDDGKGISDGLDVFGAYGQSGSKSSGVGLFICKNIIESMNGELSFESKPNHTVFMISLLKA